MKLTLTIRLLAVFALVASVGCVHVDRAKRLDLLSTVGESGSSISLKIVLTKDEGNRYTDLLQCWLVNETDSVIPTWQNSFWYNYKIVIWDSKGRVPKLTKSGSDLENFFDTHGARSKNYIVKLAPGEKTLEAEVKLSEHFVLAPDTLYTVHVVHEQLISGAWVGRICSNVIAFRF